MGKYDTTREEDLAVIAEDLCRRLSLATSALERALWAMENYTEPACQREAAEIRTSLGWPSLGDATPPKATP
jgi:hypothetical protein